MIRQEILCQAITHITSQPPHTHRRPLSATFQPRLAGVFTICEACGNRRHVRAGSAPGG